MRRRRLALLPALVALAAALALPPRAALAADTQIVVYNKGKTLRYDPDVGAELKEVFLETYDCKTGKLAKKETIEAYFHLSEDKEIITPDAICDDCRTKFLIEKKNDKYFFGGVRGKPATKEEADAAAPAPKPGEGLKSLEGKVKRIAQEIVKVDAEKKGSATQRSRIITAEFTTSLQNFGEQELTDVAGFVLEDPALNTNQKYYVLRSFGYTFFDKKDYPKAIFFYEKCVELIPDNYSAHYQKAVAHERAGENDKAIRAYAKALAAKPRENICESLKKLLGGVQFTEKLHEEKISHVKVKVDEILAALKQKETARAAEDAKALDAQIDEWYGGGTGAPKPPASPTPETPPKPSEPATPPPPGDPGMPPPPG